MLRLTTVRLQTTTTMTDAFSSDAAEETQGTRENFIARVVRSDADPDDDMFNTDYTSDYELVYELEALDHDWENLMELGVNVRKSLGSKWMVLIGHLENIHGAETIRGFSSLDDMAEFLEGKVYEFEDVDLTEDKEFTFEEKQEGKTINYKDKFGGSDNPPNPMLLPVREVTDEDELADLGVEGDGTVDEVEF